MIRKIYIEITPQIMGGQRYLDTAASSKEEIMKREVISMWALAGVVFAVFSVASVLQV